MVTLHADVHCGRLRTILFSMILILCCTLSFVPCFFLSTLLSKSSVHRIIYSIVSSFTLVTGTIAIAGYCANYIQFGLDQLLEAPSHHQALYVHWAKWSFDLTSILSVCQFLYTHTLFIAQSLG